MRSHLATGLIALVLLSVTVPATAADGPAPRIYGGAPASGDPAVVSIAVFDGGQWPGGCSGVLLRPRLILTAGHCITAPGSSANAAGFAVFPPGAPALVYRDVGPQGAASVHVINAWKPPTYASIGDSVRPDDIAILQVDADLGPMATPRLATTAEALAAVHGNAQVVHVGYGLTGPDQGSTAPFRTTLPMLFLATASERGSVFGTAQSPTAGICPGDSGSPAYLVTAAGQVLLGEMAGGNAPCSASSTYANVGFLAMGYLDLLNTALTAAGHPAIPSAPRDVSQLARNRDVIVSWSAPERSPDTVVGYDVLDASGTVVCQSTTTQCVVTGLADGDHAFTVRSRNSENEGDATPNQGPAARVSAPTPLPAPTVSIAGRHRARITTPTLVGSSSAVVTSYVVRDTHGKTVCRAHAKSSTARRASCVANVRPGRHRFTVQPVTELGTPAPSGPSRWIRVP